jgi:hypothetical protein
MVVMSREFRPRQASGPWDSAGAASDAAFEAVQRALNIN